MNYKRLKKPPCECTTSPGQKISKFLTSPRSTWHSKQSSSVQQTSPLCRLPREILQDIVTYIRPSEEACLTLTCKQLLHIIGKKSWQAVNGSGWGRERRNFGWLLVLDLPKHAYCLECSRLHRRPPWVLFERPGFANLPLKRLRDCERNLGSIQLCKGFALSHRLVYLAMRSHQLDKPGEERKYGIPLPGFGITTLNIILVYIRT